MSWLPRLSLTPLLVCAAVVAIGYLAFTTTTKFVYDYKLRDDKAEVRREIAELERDKQQLTAVRDYLESDEYIEYVARRILGLVRPGETLVVVSGVEPAAAGAGPTPQPGGNRPWWKDLFGSAPPRATPVTR